MLNPELRALFPVTKELTYLDSAHQTPLCTLVRQTLDRFLDDAELHAGPKEKWANRVEEVRRSLARLVGTTAENIAFTKNTSEGVNIAANALPWMPGDNVVLMAGEHANLTYAWLHQRRKGLEVRTVPAAPEGADAASFAGAVDDHTCAIGISHVAYDTGQRNDLASVASLCRTHRAALVVDAMQSVGVLPVDAELTTFLAAGCHKGLLTPHGLGFIYRAPAAASFLPVYAAAASTEGSPHDPSVDSAAELKLDRSARRFELGNTNYAAIYALGAALELIDQIGLATISRHVLNLADYLEDRLGPLGVAVLGGERRDRRSHIRVLDLPGAGWADYFAAQQIRVSEVQGHIRVATAVFSTERDIETFVDAVANRLRRGQSLVN